MSQHETSDCDRCDDPIVESVHRQPYPFQILIQTSEEEGMYEEHQRRLCRSCERELLDWIDNPDEDFSARADVPYVADTSRGLRELGEELTEIADELEAYNGRED